MKRSAKRFLLVLPVLALLFAILNCTVNLSSNQGSEIQQTQTALALQQTALVIQNSGINATVTAQQATLNAGVVALPPTPQPGLVAQPPVDLAATQVAIAVQQTTIAGAAGPTLLPVALESPIPPALPTAPPPVDLETQMKSASILVYEDIVDDPGEYQYVKKTLDTMGLRYKWDGNAIGWLKSDMLAGGPGGKPWDLVILAIETRTDVSGEYFDYLNDVLAAGTSVILEAWHLDEISQGAISPILYRCGVEVYQYDTDGLDINDALIWPISGVSHPLMLEPNSGMTFTKARDYWFWSLDLGSKQALTGQGDAVMLLGTNAQDAYNHGVLSVCMGGQLTLQTFSSHTFPYQVMFPLWENYIYNALKVRFSRGS